MESSLLKKPTGESKTARSDPIQQYAQRVVDANPAIDGIYLVGSSTSTQPLPFPGEKEHDIDLLYDFGQVGLGEFPESDVETLLEAQENIDLDSYDTFVLADNRYFHVSMGAGRSIVENTEYGQAQQGKPMVKLAAADQGAVQNIVAEMMPILSPGLPRPEIRLVNNMGSRWLGRTDWKYGSKGGQDYCDETTTIVVQKRILGHEETLRRVIAHELCHHWEVIEHYLADFRKMGARTFTLLRSKPGHGSQWREYASIFNSKYGKDFVTEKSDEDYVEDMTTLRDYFLLLYQQPNGHTHYQVSMRLSPHQGKWINEHVGHPEYRLLKTKDPAFLHGPAIASGRWAYAPPMKPEREEKLKALWAEAETTKIAKATAKHASTQINLPEELAWKIRDLAKKIIPESDLAGDGYEKSCHVTLKYGVEEDEEGMVEVVGGQPAFEIKLGKTHVFPPSESSDDAAVVVVKLDAPELYKLHDAIDKAMSVKEDDFEYHPHMTLAYVKPEAASKYEGLDFFEGIVFEADTVVLSKKDRVEFAVGLGQVKTASRAEDTSSLTLGANAEGFPAVVVVRWAKPLRWRQVLKAVKQIAGEVAGKRIPWRDIHVWESPWGSFAEQEEKFPEWVAKQRLVMYDILPDGTYQSVGKQHTPLTPPEKPKRIRTNYDAYAEDGTPLNPRTKEELDDFMANRKPEEFFSEYYRRTKTSSHKTPPLSDTVYENPDIGQETNAYADIPERVKGVEALPTLEELAPEMFEKTAVFAEAQNQSQHTDHKAVGMYKTPKGDPFQEEFELFGQKDKPETQEPKKNAPNTPGSEIKSLLNKAAAARHFQPVPFEQFAQQHPEHDFGDDEQDKWNYEENVEHFSTIKFPLMLYRAIELEAGQEPNRDQMGVHWTWVENSADAYFGSSSIWSPYDHPKPKNPVLVVVKASLSRPDAVDWESTLLANMINPDENEVWLESGAQLKLIGIDKDGKGYQKPAKPITITAAKDGAAKPIRRNVRGAPFKIGMLVRYVHAIEEDEAEELGTMQYLGQVGKLEYYEYSCGCGQTYPGDPMIGVRFPDGKLHEFWKEELEPVGKTSVFSSELLN